MGALPAARFLMGVLPAASAHALPFFYRKLMTDSSSPILDFYPEDFELDMNGKRFLWQAVCKLPFIKESCLFLEIGKVEHTLTEEEKQRNSLGLDILCIRKSHPLSTKIFSFWGRIKDNPKVSKAKVKRKINAEVSGGMNGYIYISDEPVCPSEINPPTDAMVMITDNKVLSVFYKFPCFHPHIPKPPEGVNMPVKGVARAFFENSTTVSLPTHLHERLNLIRGAKFKLKAKGLTPSTETIAACLNMPQQKVRNATEAVTRVFSLDRDAFPSLNSLPGETLHSYIADDRRENDPWVRVHGQARKDEVKKILNTKLGERERYIIRLYYGMDGECLT